jgi:hypothetical protein
MAGAADVAYLRGHLQAGFSRLTGLAGHKLGRKTNGLLNIEGLVAPSAKGIACPVLDQAAATICAAHNFARIHANWSCTHRLVAECQSRLSGVRTFCTTTGDTLWEVNHNCQVET